MHLIFDIGGSSTKIGIIHDKKIIYRSTHEKKENLQDFLKFLESEVSWAISRHKIQGVGFSSPGTVDSKTGIVGGMSAIEYIHTYNFAKHIQDKFDLPVAIENDANCSALAQMYLDTPDEKSIAFVVIGTGIGGALISNGELVKGRRLEAGEFGYMLLRNQDGEFTNYSKLATLPNLVTRLKEKYGIDMKPHLVLENYFNRVEPYYTEGTKMFEYLCMGLYNIQYTYDPEVIYIGGGISQSEAYINEVRKYLDQGIFKSADITIRPVKYFNDNNLFGAYANLIKSIERNERLCIQSE